MGVAGNIGGVLGRGGVRRRPVKRGRRKTVEATVEETVEATVEETIDDDTAQQT